MIDITLRYLSEKFCNGLISLLGYRREADMYLVNLIIGPHHIYAIQATVLDNSDEAVIGRDVLSHLEVTLNGPASMTEIRA